MIDRTTPPPTYPSGHISIPEQAIEILPNGVTLHMLDQGTQEVNRLAIYWQGGGSESQSPSLPGIMAELLREGSSTSSGARIAEKLDYNGAWLRSRAGEHFTKLELTSLNSRTEHVLPVLLEIISSPSFPNNSFDVIKQKAVNRRRLSMSKVSFLSETACTKLIAGEGHPHSKLELPEQIEEISSVQITDSYRRILTADRCHAFLSGKITVRIKDIVTDMLLRLPVRQKAVNLDIRPYSPSGQSEIIIDRPEAVQSAVTIGIPAIDRSHPDYNNLRLTIMALGGYFGSRLMANIREEKGYTYGISSSLMGTMEGGYIIISAQCDNRYVRPLISEVKKELTDLASRPMDNEELRRLTLHASSALATTLDTPFSMMDYYETRHILHTPDDYFEAQLSAISSLSPETVTTMASRYLDPSGMRVAIAGNKSETGL